MPDQSRPDVPRITEVLDRHGVDYLVIGGVATQAYGAERVLDAPPTKASKQPCPTQLKSGGEDLEAHPVVFVGGALCPEVLRHHCATMGHQTMANDGNYRAHGYW